MNLSSIKSDELVSAVMAAHDASARRDNISTIALCQAAAGSGSLTSALAAALCSIGGVHAPIAECLWMLKFGVVEDFISRGLKVPGFGNSFIKGAPDKDWSDVDRILKHRYQSVHKRICDITSELHRAGKLIFPNPGCYTAATAIALKLPDEIAPWLFVSGRINAWTEMAVPHLRRQ